MLRFIRFLATGICPAVIRHRYEPAAIWLEATTDNLKTRRAMRKEVERFLLWALHTRDKQLS